jgi:CSLREA domain-containing protein
LVRVVFVVGVACALMLAGAGPAEAATFMVNTTVDEPDAAPGDGNCASAPSGVCTLRAATMEANALAGDDDITLPAGNFRLTILPIPGSTPDDETRADLDILSNVSITGAGQDQTFVAATGTEPFGGPVMMNTVEIHTGASVTMAQLTVRGYAGGVDPYPTTAIVNAGTLDSRTSRSPAPRPPAWSTAAR